MKKLIAGLGNPGKKYDQNRHNFGYMILDAIAVDLGLTWKRSRDLMSFITKDKNNIYIKPTTFMNDSGEAVKAATHYFDVGSKHVLIIHDDLDFPFGTVKVQKNRSAAGHHARRPCRR